MSDTASTKISRRTFLKGTAVVGGTLIAGGVGYRHFYNQHGRDFRPSRASAYLDSIQQSGSPEALPNIIIVLVDDLGYGDLDAQTIETPNL
ncbi:MAG: twin-arginine translocation signal domain-containing protein, partial [Anaerolineae bacterium]